MAVDVAVHAADEVRRIQARHGRAGVHEHLGADAAHVAVAAEGKRPEALAIDRVILALDARVAQQRALLGVERIDPPQRLRRVLTGARHRKAAGPHAAQQIAPARRTVRPGQQHRLIVHHGARVDVRVRGHGQQQAAGDRRVLVTLVERLRAVHRCKRILAQRAAVHPIPEQRDEFPVRRQLRRKDDLARLIARQVVVVRHDAEVRQQPAHLIHADQVRADLVRPAVAVGIAIPDRQQRVGQLRGRRGHGDAQLVKPRAVDPQHHLALMLVEQRQRRDAPVLQRDHLAPLGMALEQRAQVGHVLLHHRREVDDRPAVKQRDLLSAGQIRLEERIRLHVALLHRGKQPGVFLLVGHALRLHAHAGQRFHAGKEFALRPAALHVFRLQARHRQGLRTAGAKAQDHRQQQRRSFFHHHVGLRTQIIDLIIS